MVPLFNAVFVVVSLAQSLCLAQAPIFTGYSFIKTPSTVWGPLTNGATIRQAALGASPNAFSIAALTASGSGTTQVLFWFDSLFVRTEKAAPWALNGNVGMSYSAYGPVGAIGRHNLTVRALGSNGAILATSTVVYTVTGNSSPVKAPTKSPVKASTKSPVEAPTKSPVKAPTNAPTKTPTKAPTKAPAKSPTKAPTKRPTKAPTKAPVSNYNIQLDLSMVTASDRTIFASAAAKWQSIITGDLQGFDISSFPPRTDGCQWPLFVDDMFICAQYRAIDGPLKVLAFAGPEYVRVPGGLPVSGSMTFDIEDLALFRAEFQTIILHEMGHVLGTLHLAASDVASCIPFVLLTIAQCSTCCRHWDALELYWRWRSSSQL
jgi:cell division septation protein DedD